MSALDFTPRPGAAPVGRRVLTQARTEARLLLRNGEQLLLALAIPVGLLVLGRLFAGRWLPLQTLVPSVLALAVWSTSFTALAISTGFERRYGVLERLASTPLGRGGLLLGKAGATALVTLGQFVVLACVALVLGWRPALAPLPHLLAALTVVVGAVAFASLALLMAGRLRAEITLGLANLVYLIGVSVGGVLVPPAAMPSPLGAVVAWLPTAAVADALRAASAGVADPRALLIVAGWAVLGVLLARRAFRWTA